MNELLDILARRAGWSFTVFGCSGGAWVELTDGRYTVSLMCRTWDAQSYGASDVVSEWAKKAEQQLLKANEYL